MPDNVRHFCHNLFASRVYSAFKYLALVSAVLLTYNHFIAIEAYAHGTMLVPESRMYKCRFANNPENPRDPACKAAKEAVGTAQPFYDWSAIRQGNADSRHRTLINDGQLCSGGNSIYAGMDILRSDWRSTPISADANGKFEFIYYASAVHATKDMIFYITKSDWQPGSIMRWSDMDEFCRFDNVPLTQFQGKSVYKMSCKLPQRSGKHVIFNVWQRSDSGEAFYSCSDVSFSGTNTSRRCGDVACFVPSIHLLLEDLS